MKRKPYEELVQLLQENKINWLEFIRSGDFAEDFTEWCQDNNLPEDDNNAHRYIEFIEQRMMEAQSSPCPL